MSSRPIRSRPSRLSHASHDRPRRPVGPTDASAEAAPADANRWRWRRLLLAPHRAAFAAAAALLAASGLWWAWAMTARALGIDLPWALPPSTAHGLVMSFGFMPLFFAGFLFTAGPKWLHVHAVSARELVAPLLLQLAGWSWFMLGAHGPDAAFGKVFGGLGLAAVAFGWSWVCARFIGLLRASRAGDRLHPRLVAAAGIVGALALAGAAFGVATGSFALVRAVTLGGLWGFVGVVYVAVADRMLPFFDAAALPALAARQPLWLLAALVALFGIEAVLAVAQALGAGMPTPLAAMLAGLELAAGAGLLALAWRWAWQNGLRFRLLAMLWTGFVWLGLAFVLAGVSRALVLLGNEGRSLGLAPLHAYAMGFLGSTFIAMVARVSSGYAGRSVAGDGFLWRLFWLLQFVVAMRVAAAMLASAGAWAAIPLTLVAALGWAGVCVAWAGRYGRWYGQARADGRPG